MKTEIIKNKKMIGLNINYREIGIVYALIIFLIILFLTNETFRKPETIMSVLRESAFVGVSAIGMTFCIISGDFDLSVGSLLALLSVITISLVGVAGLAVTILVVLLLGFGLGTLNGVFIGKLRIPAFITTLGMYFIYRAIAYIYTGTKTIKFQERWFTQIGSGDFLGIPIPFAVFIILAIIGALLLRRTRLGRYIIAIGNSEKASYISGINIARVKILIFALVSFFTAVSAVLLSSRLWSAHGGMQEGYEFDVITAVVLGGTSISGGKGSIFNTVVAVIFLTCISTAMNLYHVDSYWQYVIKGLILLLAFSMNTIRELLENRINTTKETSVISNN